MSIAEGIYPAWSNKHKIVALIPAYNEERFIGSVVLKAGRLVDRVIVVDDGSEDATAEVARAAGAIVIRHLHNIGKGAALNTGFRKICESDADVVVCIDGDGPFYDSSEYYDHLHRARTQAAFRPSYLLDNMGGLLKNAITLVALFAILIPYGLWVPIVLFLSTIPSFYFIIRHNQHLHDWYVRTTEDDRRTGYFDWLLTARATAAEVRLYGLGEQLRGTHRLLRSRLRKERMALVRKQGIFDLGANLLSLLVTAGTMIWMVLQALRGLATLGDLALFYRAFERGQMAMGALLRDMGQMYANSLFLQHFFEFMELKPQIADPIDPVPVPRSVQLDVCFHKVSFRYPGNRRAVLDDFNLTIPAGKIAAIVGRNGAGKSTLVKLLCRLYDAESGRIEIDGIDIRRFRNADLRRLVTVLFQEPVHYHDTAAQNIALGALNGESEDNAVKRAAQAAGIDSLIASLPNGYDNLLGTWFQGGTELSLGEWQRIALARTFMRHAPILVLDEPTGAMDPWAEAEWLSRFRALAADRTVVVITHRFTTARYADIVHVMDAGRIVESGTQVELLGQNGRYAHYWQEELQDHPWQLFDLQV